MKTTSNGGSVPNMVSVPKSHLVPAQDIRMYCDTYFGLDKDDVVLQTWFKGNDCRPQNPERVEAY